MRGLETSGTCVKGDLWESTGEGAMLQGLWALASSVVS